MDENVWFFNLPQQPFKSAAADYVFGPEMPAAERREIRGARRKGQAAQFANVV